MSMILNRELSTSLNHENEETDGIYFSFIQRIFFLFTFNHYDDVLTLYFRSDNPSIYGFFFKLLQMLCE